MARESIISAVIGIFIFFFLVSIFAPVVPFFAQLQSTVLNVFTFVIIMIAVAIVIYIFQRLFG